MSVFLAQRAFKGRLRGNCFESSSQTRVTSKHVLILRKCTRVSRNPSLIKCLLCLRHLSTCFICFPKSMPNLAWCENEKNSTITFRIYRVHFREIREHNGGRHWMFDSNGCDDSCQPLLPLLPNLVRVTCNLRWHSLDNTPIENHSFGSAFDIIVD